MLIYKIILADPFQKLLDQDPLLRGDPTITQQKLKEIEKEIPANIIAFEQLEDIEMRSSEENSVAGSGTFQI